jgi:hypothetical protein
VFPLSTVKALGGIFSTRSLSQYGQLSLFIMGIPKYLGMELNQSVRLLTEGVPTVKGRGYCFSLRLTQTALETVDFPATFFERSREGSLGNTQET